MKINKFAFLTTPHGLFTTSTKAVNDIIFLKKKKEEESMYSFELLEKDCYYIVQLQPAAVLTLIQVKVVTDNCMFIVRYNETAEMQWVKKEDIIQDIVECLTDEAAGQWLTVYNNSEDASYYEEDEE